MNFSFGDLVEIYTPGERFDGLFGLVTGTTEKDEVNDFDFYVVLVVGGEAEEYPFYESELERMNIDEEL
ncbi:hypothetical protein [Streptomyces sp. NPDC002644]